MPEEIKILNGGLNQDDAPENISVNDYISAHNFRGTGTSLQEEFYGTNIESTTLITPSGQLGAGINKAIGAKAFPNVKKSYTFKYNSLGKHKLVEFDSTTLIETVLFTDLYNSGGTQIFSVTPNHYFIMELIHEEFLVMTDGVSGTIYNININRLKSGGYGVVSKDDFNLIKRQNLVPIKAKYVSDVNTKSNLLKGKLFQFRNQNGFDDYIKSAWSTISERPVPNEELIDALGDDPTKLNAIQLTTKIDNDDVKYINFAFREGLFDWYIFKSVKIDYIKQLPNSFIDISNEIYEAYNPITQEYSFLFYNDGVGEAIPATDTDELYDHVPLNAGALEVVNGNILVLGDIQTGYDRPEGLRVSLSAVGYKPDLDVSIEDPRNFTISGSSTRIRTGGFIGTQRRFASVILEGTPKAGDKIYINLGMIDSNLVNETISYEVLPAEDGNLSSVAQNIYNKLPSTTYDIYRKMWAMQSPTRAILGFVTASKQELKSTILDLNQTGNLEGQTVNILKSNSAYQLALFHFDRYGRAFPIVTGDDFAISTLSFAETQGQATSIGWALDGTPPEGAVSYQWGISENNKYQNTKWLTGIYDTDESKGDYIVFNLASLADFNKDTNQSTVFYDFTEGDRVTLQYKFTDDSPTPIWFNNPPLDFAVSGFEIKVDTDATPNVTKYLLKIKKSTILPTVDIENSQILFEIYTPKKNNQSLESKVFHEIGEQFDIVNGEYSIKTGSIFKGDAYTRPRKLMSVEEGSNDVYALPVEDFNFSDDYISNYWSAGRGRVYNDEVGRVRNKASFRYSDSYVLGSQNNNINRFYQDRIYGEEPSQTTSIYGAIVALIMRDRYLIAIQELKVSHIPVNSSVIEDANSQQGLVISKDLFNPTVYLSSDFGAGGAKKAIAVSKNGTVYFVDPNNGVPCRDGYDGLKVINTKMTKYFIEKLKQANPDSIVAHYDDFNDEYTISFQTTSGVVEVINFNGGNFEYRDNYNYTIDDVTIVPPQHGTTEITLDGNIKYTPNTNYIGEDSVGITFSQNSVVISKNACIDVVSGSTEPQDFSFVPLFNQELEVWAESNANFLQGTQIAVPISIVGGEYSINDGAWTDVSGLIYPNDKFKVRVFTSDDYEEETSTTLTISGKSATFKVKTKEIGTTFYSAAKSGTATRNNCASGQTGSVVTYTVPAGAYTSTISQADADQKAQDDVDLNKQTYANTNGTCTVSIGNDARSGSFIKNNCGLGQIGSRYTYIVPANTFFASTKALANAMAVAKVEQDGQATANVSGYCDPYAGQFLMNVTMYPDFANVTFNSADPRQTSFVFLDGGVAKSSVKVNSSFGRDGVTRSIFVPIAVNPETISTVDLYVTAVTNTVTQSVKGTFKKNGVFAGDSMFTMPNGRLAGSGVVIRYAMPLSISMLSTDTLTLELGTPSVSTVYYSAEVSRSATKNDCLSGQVGSTVTLTVPYGAFTSTISQADANNKATSYAEANKQSNANANGTCTSTTTFYNIAKSGTATKNDCTPPSIGSTVTYTVPAGVYSSTISQADADNKAQNDVDTNKQAHANAAGLCDLPTMTWWNIEKSGTATRNNCGGGFTGSTVTYIVPANTYSSYISQADADNKAQADVEANKQSYANANGTCPNTIYPSRWIPIDPYCEL